MDLTQLEEAVHNYLGNCVVPATRAAYRSAQRRYSHFCLTFGINPPISREETLCRFVAFLGKEGLKHCTIKAYLSGLRFTQIHLTLGNPFLDRMPTLDHVLSGIKHTEARTAPASYLRRLPVTIDIMRNLKSIWLSTPPHPDSVMLWAASCTGFFGFLRAGEFTVPSLNSYDASVHLNLGDLAVDSHTAPSVIQLHI